MNPLNALLTNTNFAEKINNQSGISCSMMKMRESQESWQKQIGVMTMYLTILT